MYVFFKFIFPLLQVFLKNIYMLFIRSSSYISHRDFQSSHKIDPNEPCILQFPLLYRWLSAWGPLWEVA